MKFAIKRFLCRFGWHDWDVWEKTHTINRYNFLYGIDKAMLVGYKLERRCNVCGKFQFKRENIDD